MIGKLHEGLALLCTLPLCAGEATTTITGRIAGEDGKPARKSIAQLYEKTSGNAFEQAEADSDGRFTLKTDRKGLLVLKLAGVGHLSSTALLPVDQPGSIRVNARLARPAFRNVDWTDKPVWVTGAKESGKLKPQADGTFVAEVATKEDSPTVRIGSGAPDTRQFTLADAAEYRVANRSYYTISVHEAVVKPVDGKVKVVLDPKKLQPSKRAAEIRVKGLGKEYADLQEVWQQIERGSRLPEEQRNSETTITAARAAVGQTTGQLAKELAWFHWASILIGAKKTTAADARQILAGIRPESPVWRNSPYTLTQVLRAGGDDPPNEDYFRKAAEALPKEERTSLWGGRFYNLLAASRYDEMRPIMEQMQKESPTGGYTKNVIRRVGGLDMNTLPGKKLPSWEASDLNDPNKKYTHEILTAKARIYLLDFWASW